MKFIQTSQRSFHRAMKCLVMMVFVLGAVHAQAQTWYTKAQAVQALETQIAGLNSQLNVSTPHTSASHLLEAGLRFYESILDKVNNNIPLSEGVIVKSSALAHYSTDQKDFNPVSEQERLALVAQATELLSD